MTPVLHIEGVDKIIDGKTILKNINLEANKGEIIGLLGPNGSGKTTLIKLMTGLIKQSSGSIIINGFPIDRQFEKAIQAVGAIVENPEFYSYLTGYENLIHYANMHKDITQERLDEVVERVGLEDAIDDKVKTYSLGMRQRLGIAQAILHRPKLLILDEPTNGLDPAGMKDFRDHLRELAKEEGTVILFATHLLKEVEDLCDRVVILQNGRVKSTVTLHGAEEKLEKALLEVQPEEKALQWLKGNGYEAWTEKGLVAVKVEKRKIPSLNKQLVMNDIDVYSIAPFKQSLEDEYMTLTAAMEEEGDFDVQTHQK
ncbi:ABC transporter ATP-binding protein [Bacillus glycinifermentans]|uniref:ABC transporter ATP-binding protein n=1 Tax=Bacillus glycinifermentans TaxID=1664069 RepID=A0A0J6HRC8_9BACI|nr:ABC transporter ATP-binding protein [Bacillus glycinifermentans]ATH94430.1 ABC transporter ATP-binding protein [Bacillus glycinifermentans]KMM61547.1 ABC transporter ATP-binding protein [Bacillus glycinifermentans]KRT95856.1 ABC transporter ATP-binding protein [Bacillus glycinifermentans]MEC0484228.1 ABC transporter ATP-binding protein [Bacillus glycinifermentans]MEC0494379.1 ABC transporter ATP-binding protein [Bacillus glycinifermentans]